MRSWNSRRWSHCSLVLVLSALATTPARSEPVLPRILSVQLAGTNVTVRVRVPAGLRRVFIEGRDRLGTGPWTPRAVARLSDDAGGEVSIPLIASGAIELLRARADASDPLPSSFYSGTNVFFEVSSGSTGPGGVLTPNDAVDPGRAAGGDTTSREVVESDIWRFRGQTLYFFNQLRGLQVIDVTDPDSAAVRGTLELPASGENLYVADDTHVVLLAQSGCDYNQSQVVIVDVAPVQPVVAQRLPISGFIQESRMVGTALYVTSQTYRPVAATTNTTWEWGTQVSAFDLANPATPVARPTLWYPGYGNVVSATDRLLFVVSQDPTDWWQSIVRCIDITAPDGTMRAYQSIRTAGRVPDKFKLRWDGGVFTAISEDWRPVVGRTVTTKLETFRLPDPRSLGPAGVMKLGELELGRGEQLHATRFDGDRAYVVTFFRIDPLWVVDLSNPSAPHLAGSVDVPGWSTFIQPLGSRLVAIGIETNRVAVSLFDVANPAAPALLSRVRLGRNYSYSEANWDEKAFTVLPDAGLILVPFSGDTTNGYASSVQLVDLQTDSLQARGIIDHPLQPRRTTLYLQRILSISSAELLSVDAADRDHPVVRGQTWLAWAVDRVFLHGDFLVELGSSDSWGGWWNQARPVLRSVPSGATSRVLDALNLPELAVLGAAQHDHRLYVLQGPQGAFYPPIPLDSTDPSLSDAGAAKILLTVLDLTTLPTLTVTGRVEAAVMDPNIGFGFWAGFDAVWPTPGVLVFVGGGFDYGWRCLECPMPLLAADGAFARIWPPYFGGGGGALLAFDLKDPATPAFASALNLSSNAWWNFSPAFAADGLVYLSHQTSEFLPLDPALGVTNSPAAGGALVAVDPAAPILYPVGNWVSRSFLDVVDYTDPRQPVARPPVNIPGRLQGISRGGAVLYTLGTHWNTNLPLVWTEFLDASAYDGVAAHLVDSLALPATWPRPVLVSPESVFLGLPGDTVDPAGSTPVIETWRLSDSGRLERIGRVPLKVPGSAFAYFDGLLAVAQTDTGLSLFDATDPASLAPVGVGHPAGCLWYDLSKADGALSSGVWVPLGAYGVGHVASQ